MCDWTGNVGALGMTSPPWYREPLLSSATLTTFWTRTPFWPRWLQCGATSLADARQVLYAYRGYERKCSNVARIAVQPLDPANAPVFRRAFCFVCTCRGFAWVPRAASGPPKVNSLPSKSERVFARNNRGKASGAIGRVSELYFTRPVLWWCYTSGGKPHSTGFSQCSVSTWSERRTLTSQEVHSLAFWELNENIDSNLVCLNLKPHPSACELNLVWRLEAQVL